jgi:hypothetical protein
MSLVSRRFSSLAHEILYHEFAPGYGDSWYSMEFEWYWRLEPFLRTVASNPDRAALVKRVHVNINLLCCVTEYLGERTEMVLRDAARARGIDVADFVGPFRALQQPVYPDRYRPGADELLGMLLACLPQLKSLSLSWGAPLCGVPASALRIAGVSSLPLETLDITCCDEMTGARLDGILELASSTIRNLYLEICDGHGLRLLTRHGPFPNLRNLCIANDRHSGSELTPFLSRCVNLETFSYESGGSRA